MRNLRVQLLVSHLILVLIMGIAMSYSISTFFRLSNSIDSVMTTGFGGAIAAQNMQLALDHQSHAMDLALAGDFETARNEFNATWPELIDAYRQEAAITDPRLKQQVRRMQRLMDEYNRAATDMLVVHPPVTRLEAEDRYARAIRPVLLQMDDLTHNLTALNESEIMNANDVAKRDAHKAAVASLIITGASIVVAIVLAAIAVRLALRPLGTFARQAEAIGSGDLSQRIDLHRTDEVGALAKSFNNMADNLAELRRHEARRLKRAERMADVALEFLYDPVVVTDATGRIVFLNRAAEGLWGPSPSTPRTPIVEHVGDRRIVKAIQNAVQENRVSAEEDETTLIPIKVGDTERTYRLRATPMKDAEGGTLGCVAVLEDITHLRDLDRLKSEFIGVASHELRTPVTSLLLGNQLLKEGSTGPLNKEQMQILDAQYDDLDRLDRLMKELLDVTRLEASSTPIRLELVRPRELIRQAYQSCKARAGNKGVKLIPVEEPDLPTIRLDKSQILRVLVNLIDNAIRHTQAGGKVEIRADDEDNQVTFRVADTGSGIPPEYLDRIFDRFVQVPGATQGGAGLGLSIAQMILKAHGSEMSVQSELDKGSTFSFSFKSENHSKEEAES